MVAHGVEWQVKAWISTACAPWICIYKYSHTIQDQGCVGLNYLGRMNKWFFHSKQIMGIKHACYSSEDMIMWLQFEIVDMHPCFVPSVDTNSQRIIRLWVVLWQVYQAIAFMYKLGDEHWWVRVRFNFCAAPWNECLASSVLLRVIVWWASADDQDT